MASEGTRIELLYLDGCPSHERLLSLVRRLADEAGAGLALRRIETPDDAERERFLGSPTIRVNGRDVDPHADQRSDYGLKCRLYRCEEPSLSRPFRRASESAPPCRRRVAEQILFPRLRELLDADAQLVEVLPADEYADQHLPGALNIPLKTLDAASAAQLDRTRAVVVYCWDGL